MFNWVKERTEKNMKNFHARKMKDVLILRNNIDNGALCNGILKIQNQQMHPNVFSAFASLCSYNRNEFNRKCNMLSATWFELSPRVNRITSTLKQMRYLFWLFVWVVCELNCLFFSSIRHIQNEPRATIVKQFTIRISLFNFHSSYFDISG